jgi:hypothetical protein
MLQGLQNELDVPKQGEVAESERVADLLGGDTRLQCSRGTEDRDTCTKPTTQELAD